MEFFGSIYDTWGGRNGAQLGGKRGHLSWAGGGGISFGKRAGMVEGQRGLGSREGGGGPSGKKHGGGAEFVLGCEGRRTFEGLETLTLFRIRQVGAHQCGGVKVIKGNYSSRYSLERTGRRGSAGAGKGVIRFLAGNPEKTKGWGTCGGIAGGGKGGGMCSREGKKKQGELTLRRQKNGQQKLHCGKEFPKGE